MWPSILLCSFAVLRLLEAQSSTGSDSPTNTPDPTAITGTERSQWCKAQMNTCPILCSGSASSNECSSRLAPRNPPFNTSQRDLAYNCLCTSNSSTPGLQYYKLTIPTFLCEQKFQDCVAAAANDVTAQEACQRNEQANCGQLDPDTFVVGSDSGSSSTGSGVVSSASSQDASSSIGSSRSSTSSLSPSTSSARVSATASTGSAASASRTRTRTNSSTTPTSSSQSESTNASSSSSGGLSTGAKAGIGIGVSLGVLLLVGLAFWYGRRSARKHKGIGGESGSTYTGKAELSSEAEKRRVELGGGEVNELPAGDGRAGMAELDGWGMGARWEMGGGR